MKTVYKAGFNLVSENRHFANATENDKFFVYTNMSPKPEETIIENSDPVGRCFVDR